MDEESVAVNGTGGVRCAFVGGEPLVAQCADIARTNGLEVVLLATANAVVREFGEDQGIPVVADDTGLVAGLDDHRVDVLFSITNDRAVPDDALARVATTIHLHDGPMPEYAGLNVTTWAILNGETQHAITWHLLPDGEILATEQFPIAPDDTAFSLNARCYEAALASFPLVAAALASGGLSATRHGSDGPGRTLTRHDRPAVLFDPAAAAATSERAVRALDLGSRIHNTVGSVRWVIGDEAYVVGAAHLADGTPTTAPPGSVVGLDASGVRIATADGDLVVDALGTAEGVAVDVRDVLARQNLAVGDVLPSPPADLVTSIAENEPAMADDEAFWLDRLAVAEPTTPSLGASSAAAGASRTSRTITLPAGADEVAALTAFVLWLARTTGTETVTFAVTDAASRDLLARVAPLARPGVASVVLDDEATFADVTEVVAAELAAVRGRHPLLRDAIGRDPRSRERSLPVPVLIDLDAAGDASASGDGAAGAGDAAVRLALGSQVLVIDAVADPDDPGAIDRAAEQISTVLAAGVADPAATVSSLPLLGPAETALLDSINRTEVDYDRSATIDSLFRAQVERTPDAPALSSDDRTLTYRELDEAVASLAARLAEAGVTRGDRVGIAVARTADMVIGVLATLDLGAAYLPLDPTYPTERLAFMVDDAGIGVLVATGSTAAQLDRPALTVVDPIGQPGATGATGDARTAGHDPTDLAYLIYTSGSTGMPKGVMLEHRQVTNFFEAMDRVIDHDPPGVWLAVTSLSFDISVLELLWTLTRGFHVVLKADRGVPSVSPTGGSADVSADISADVSAGFTADVSTEPRRPVALSLFYFAAGEDAASDGYRLLLDSARFADRNGFEAVWTPERHFHAFGGAYPNPSVTAAALAVATENVGVRAGSVVLPLHSPIRVAEEWAVVDNLSRGRVGISFAAGWQPNDFVLKPDAFATAKEDLARNIELVQRLWRGDTVEMPGHDGAPVEVGTLPRPSQAELPVWLTSAGSPATFERAGTLGVNLLTHLLGQSVDQLAANIERYRRAWDEAGHPGAGVVTLMIHTYLDRDADVAREVAREPMKEYLGTAVGLLRDFASAFPIFSAAGKGSDDLFKSLTPDELDQLLEMAAQRYLGTSGLFGTPDDAAATIEAVSAVGVDEVACLIDFGVDTDDVMRSLDLLLEAKAQVDARRTGTDRPAPAAPTPPTTGDDTVPSSGTVAAASSDTVAALVARHGVTHLQCTPSLAAMLVADPADKAALGSIDHLMLGGEALPTALAAELRALLPGRFTNMYGPTETTIWSLTHELDGPPGASIPIGTPIANTTIFVLDPAGRRLPFGAFGELHIGGEGVARGYHERPELTAERFVDRPGMGRVYATGDVVRIHAGGHVEFAGRADNQVKIRGHRIELGEIESVLDQHPDVVQSVVVARDDRGDVRLVAYVMTRRGAEVTSDALRKHVGETLPDAMVPSSVLRLDAFPLTPNGKIDRKALPADTGSTHLDAEVTTAPPAGDTEQLVAEIWSSELGRPVGRDDNFFDIGGHSLLAVKVFRRLSDTTDAPLALTDVFRYPTIRTFAAHLRTLEGTTHQTAAEHTASRPSGTDRGAMRRRALTRRGRGSEEGSG